MQHMQTIRNLWCLRQRKTLDTTLLEIFYPYIDVSFHIHQYIIMFCVCKVPTIFINTMSKMSKNLFDILISLL